MFMNGLWNDRICSFEENRFACKMTFSKYYEFNLINMLIDTHLKKDKLKFLEQNKCLLLSYLLDTLPTFTETCPQEWEYWNEKCYYISDNYQTFNISRTKCKEVDGGADLLSVHSQEESDHVDSKWTKLQFVCRISDPWVNPAKQYIMLYILQPINGFIFCTGDCSKYCCLNRIHQIPNTIAVFSDNKLLIIIIITIQMWWVTLACNGPVYYSLSDVMGDVGMSWIGLYHYTGDEPWGWTDGSDYDFEYWAPGQPNDPDNELCALKQKEGDGRYHDYPCDSSFNYACEYFPSKIYFYFQHMITLIKCCICFTRLKSLSHY